MTTPTVAVTIESAAFTGSPVANGSVVLQLTAMDVVAGTNGTTVANPVITVPLDASGKATEQLFPNSLSPVGLGTRGTSYKVTILDSTGAQVGSGFAQIPNTACNLHDNLVNIANPTGLTDGVVAVQLARSYRDQAAASQSAVAYIYPGTYATPPTKRPDGTAIQAGDKYVNSADGYAYVYVNGAWASDAKKAAQSALSVAFLYPGTYASAPTTRPDSTAIQNGDRYNNSTDGYEYIRINGAWTNGANQAQAAQTSASQASASATAAAGSATNASNSATTAGNYAAAAATGAKFFDTIAQGVTGGTLAAGTYYYKVTALTAAGETTGSSEVSVTTTITGSISLSWGAVTGATGYKVYRGTAAGSENAYFSPGNVTTFTDTGAAGTAGTVPSSNTAAIPAPTASAPSTAVTGGTLAAATYYYKVTALGASGETIGSNEVSVTTTGATSSNTVTWGAVTGATGYRVYRGTAAAGENTYYAPGNVTTFTDTGAAGTAGSPPASNTATIPAPSGIVALGCAPSGTTFGVKAGGSDGLTRPAVYRNDSGTATLLWSILPATEFDAEIVKVFEPNVQYAICDANDNAVFVVYNDGSVGLTDITVNSLNGVPSSSLQSISSITSTVEIAAFSIADANGNVAFEVKSDGTIHVSDLVIDSSLNGSSVSSLTSGSSQANMGNYAAELVFFDNNGQSLGEGSYGNQALTTSQEFDNIGFPALASSPTSFVTLTVANTQAYNPPGTGRGESPMYGAISSIKERIAAENGLSYTQQAFQLAACNNAVGGSYLSQHIKGTGNYTTVMSQVQAAYSIAQSQGRTCKVGAKFWTQGESYETGYQAMLQQLANDFDADVRAITGQAEPVLMVCYQTPSLLQAALDQIAASDANSKILIASPAYFLTFGDNLHIDTSSARILGAYYGICYKRAAVDGITWSPLRPISSTRQGAILNVKYHVPVRPLAIDTVLNPAQTNYGFTLTDSLGNAITINSVSVIEPDTVKIVAAAAVPAGAILSYACNTAVNKGPFIGGCGNLRDSQGNNITFRGTAMHNWCVVNKFTIN